MSLDLKIDRSNISRILNQLFLDNKLIKVDGRPTLYLDRSLIERNYPYSEIPNKLKKEEFELFFKTNQYTSNKKLKLDIIGCQKNESLYTSIFQLVQIFLYPSQLETYYIIEGEDGTGKKFILESLMDFAKKKHTYEDNQQIYYCPYALLDSDFQFFYSNMDTKKYPIIVIMLDNQVVNLNKSRMFINSIYSKYKNENTPFPTVFVLKSPTQDPINQKKMLQHEYFFIPNLRDRTSQEKIKLILHFFVEEAKFYHKEIKIPKKFISCLFSNNYDNNILGLNKEIHYLVAQNLLFDAGAKNLPLLLNESHISKQFIESAESFDISLHYPQLENIISVKPSSNINKILNQTNAPSKFINNSDSHKSNVWNDIFCKYSTLLNNVFIDNNNIYESRLNETIFSKDIPALKLLAHVFEDFEKDRVSIHKYKIDQSIKVSNAAKNITNQVKNIIKTRPISFEISNAETSIIEHIIEQSLIILNRVEQPVIIIGRNNIAKNYAETFNSQAKTRSLFSIHYTTDQIKDLNQFLKIISKKINTMNRGRGVILFVDKPELIRLMGQSSTHFKVPVFTFTPISAPLIAELSVLKTSKFSNASSKVIKLQNKVRKNLSASDLSIKSERINNTYISKMNILFQNINTDITNEVIFEILEKLSNKLNFKLNNFLIIDFLFNANYLLSAILDKNLSVHDIPLIENNITFTLKEICKNMPELKDIEIPNEAFTILNESIDNYLK